MSKKVNYDFSNREFINELNRNNITKAYITSWLSVGFALAMFIVDIYRYKSGEFAPSHERYTFNIVLFICHILFFLNIFIVLAIRKNLKIISENITRYTEKILLFAILYSGLVLLTMGFLTVVTRGSFVAIIAFVIVCNHLFLLPLKQRLVFNTLSLIILLVSTALYEASIPDKYIMILEGLGIVIPSNFISYVQLKMRYDIFLINKKLKAKNESILEINKGLMAKSLQGQMNPHFIFNTLNSIQHFMLGQDQKSSMAYLSKFAKLIRLIFRYSDKNVISLEEEIEFLKLYLYLEELRFENKVKVIFNISSSIKNKAYDMSIPPLIIQPLIENAFKHGLMHKEQGGILEINLFKKDNNIICEIKDNGVGRKKSNEYVDDLSINRKSRDTNRQSALDIIKQRLKILNELAPIDQNNYSNSLAINDLVDEYNNPTGTEVILSLHLENHIYLEYSEEMDE